MGTLNFNVSHISKQVFIDLSLKQERWKIEGVVGFLRNWRSKIVAGTFLRVSHSETTYHPSIATNTIRYTTNYRQELRELRRGREIRELISFVGIYRWREEQKRHTKSQMLFLRCLNTALNQAQWLLELDLINQSKELDDVQETDYGIFISFKQAQARCPLEMQRVHWLGY